MFYVYVLHSLEDHGLYIGFRYEPREAHRAARAWGVICNEISRTMEATLSKGGNVCLALFCLGVIGVEYEMALHFWESAHSLCECGFFGRAVGHVVSRA